jgi:hypothetical protein
MLRLILYAKSISFRPPYRSLGFRSDGVPSVRLVLTFIGQARQLMLGLALTGEAEYWPSRCSLWFHPSDGLCGSNSRRRSRHYFLLSTIRPESSDRLRTDERYPEHMSPEGAAQITAGATCLPPTVTT